MSSLMSRVLVLGVGALFGMVFTFGHQARLVINEVGVPWGLVVALIGTVAIILGVRLFASRLFAGWLAAGLVLAIVVLSLPGLGGSVLVPANLAGMVWAIAPSLLAVLIVIWPASRAVRR